MWNMQIASQTASVTAVLFEIVEQMTVGVPDH
jgi:hypothetical protein